MELEIITTHISKSSWSFQLAEEYVTKLKAFDKVRFNVIKNEKKFLDKVKPGDRVICCDEHGEAFTSRQFSKKISHFRDGGVQKLIFFVGGPFGLAEDVLQRADLKLQLSRLVMNQEVALTVLMEQIFRAYTIIHNHPYHND